MPLWRDKNYVCQLGDRYFKKKEWKSCRAHIEIWMYILYPEYSVNVAKTLFAWKTRTIQESKLEELRISLKTRKEAKLRENILSLPTEETHHQTHLTGGIHGMSQKVHPQVAEKIRELVSDGINDTSFVS